MSSYYKMQIMKKTYESYAASQHKSNTDDTYNATSDSPDSPDSLDSLDSLDSIKPWLRKYIDTAIASAVELTVGQPLDRLKIHYQSQNTKAHTNITNIVNNINASSNNMIRNKYIPKSSSSSSFGINWRYWYAGTIPSAIQRCGIYFPGIKAAEELTNNIINKDAKLEGYIFKPFIVSAVVTPYVTLFDAFKTYRQQSAGTSASSRHTLPILEIWKERGTKSLMRAWFPTFSREYCFVGGMLILQPYAHNYLNQTLDSGQYSSLVPWIGSSLGASIISQVVSQPLDVWKTYIEIHPQQSIWVSLRHITFNNNTSLLWTGLAPRVIRGAWTFGCVNAIIHYLLPSES